MLVSVHGGGISCRTIRPKRKHSDCFDRNFVVDCSDYGQDRDYRDGREAVSRHERHGSYGGETSVCKRWQDYLRQSAPYRRRQRDESWQSVRGGSKSFCRAHRRWPLKEGHRHPIPPKEPPFREERPPPTVHQGSYYRAALECFEPCPTILG